MGGILDKKNTKIVTFDPELPYTYHAPILLMGVFCDTVNVWATFHSCHFTVADIMPKKLQI